MKKIKNKCKTQEKRVNKYIIVKNALGEDDTNAEVIVQQQITYIPKVSVIIPVYNVEKYLRQCLNSVLSQTLREIEVICIDDGSTDSSLTILLEYAALDKRISVLKQQNLHAGVARNAGLEVATGAYLIFLDSDDFFEPDMLERMYHEAKKNNADIVICNADKYDDNTKSYTYLDAVNSSLAHQEVFSLQNIKEKAYFVTQPATWNKMYSSSFLQKYPIKYQNLKSCNDFGFSYAVLSMAERICILPNIFVHYRKSSNTSISSGRSKTAYNIVYAYLYIKNILKQYDKSFLLPQLDERFIAALKYEGSLCSIEDANIFKQQAKRLLKEDYQKFIRYMPIEKIPIVVAADNNYAETLAVCLYSILQNTSSYIDFFILSDGITAENIRKIKASINRFKNFTISFIDMNKFNLQQFPQISRFTGSVFSRYFIPDICKKYDKVIYTDADVVFMDDIKFYYDIDLEGKGIAAVSEELGKIRGGKYNHEYRKKLFGISPSHQYFANGNIILSCKYWKEHNITEKLINKTKELENLLVCPDLDVMNIIFQNNYKRLHFMYCATVHRYMETDGNEEMLEGYRHPFIIHYSGIKKPWKTKDVLFFKEYDEIAKHTAFRTQSNVVVPKVGPAMPVEKRIISYRILKIFSLFTYKIRGGKQEWKCFGLPIWKVRKIESNSVKYYLLNILLFEIFRRKQIGKK